MKLRRSPLAGSLACLRHRPLIRAAVNLEQIAGLVSPTFVGQDDLKEEDGDVWIVYMLLLFNFDTFPRISCRVC